MTTPAPRTGPDEVALVAVEHRVRQRILRALAGIVSRAGPAVAVAARTRPGAGGAELVSAAEVHTALTEALARSGQAAEAAVRAGHSAAAKLGLATARAELRRVGHAVPGGLGADADYLDAVIVDLRRAFAGALPDLQQVITEAVDGVRGNGSGPVRVLTVHAALRRSARRLAARATAAGSAAVRRGFADTQAAGGGGDARGNPSLRAVKTWQVRGDDPCPACLALDGTTVALEAQFDRSAGAGEKNPGVYRDLRHPPRHPNCRCRLVYGFAAENSVLSFR